MGQRAHMEPDGNVPVDTVTRGISTRLMFTGDGGGDGVGLIATEV